MKSVKGNYNTISKFANTTLLHCRRKWGTCNRIYIRKQKLHGSETKHANKSTNAKFSLRSSTNFYDAQFREKHLLREYSFSTKMKKLKLSTIIFIGCLWNLTISYFLRTCGCTLFLLLRSNYTYRTAAPQLLPLV